MKILFNSVGIALLIVLALSVLASSAYSVIIMLAWNYTMPPLFGLPELTFLQTFALFVMINMIFKIAFKTKEIA